VLTKCVVTLGFGAIHRAWSITVLLYESRFIASQEELVSIVEVATCDTVWQFDHVRSDAVNLTDAWHRYTAEIGNGSAW